MKSASMSDGFGTEGHVLSRLYCISGFFAYCYSKDIFSFFFRPKYDMMTLALHEGNPGHHLQSSFLLAMGKVIP